MALGVPYRMYNKIRNCGDAINPYIIEHVSGLPAVYDDRAVPHVLGIGSIFAYAGPLSLIWGSGIRDPNIERLAIEPRNVRALRGHLTLGRLHEAGYDLPHVVLGDPGILADELVAPERIAKRHRVAVVPHHGDFQNPAYRALAARDDVCIVDMMDASLEPLRRIAEAEVVLSQSLHGLIFAEALGIPSTWIAKRTDDVWRFKFRDWYSTTESPDTPPHAVADPFEELVGAARLAGSRIDRAALRAAFPREAAREMPADLLGHEACKVAEPVTIPLDLAGPGSAALPAREVLRAYGAEMRRFAFPVYAVVGAPVADEALLRKMLRIMDESTACVFGTVVRRADLPEGTPLRNRRGIDTTDASDAVGATLILRPHGRLDYGQKRMAFVLD